MPPSVVLCVPTYRRPDGLRTLLQHVACLEGNVSLVVIVVDNDATRREGAAVVRSLRRGFPFTLNYEVEPRRGHTYAYNRCFALACETSPTPDYVAVLDDDEFPDRAWLEKMLLTANEFGVDIVGGPVFPVFSDRNHWLAKTGLYDPRRFGRGPVPSIYGAGNMMIRRDVLAAYLDKPFSHDFAFTGGSDLDFFRRCQRDGRKFAWADDAYVFETVPRSRLKATWLLLRAFRIGTDLTRTDRRCSRGIMSFGLRWIKGIGLVCAGVATVPIAAARGRGYVMKSLCMCARGVGRIAAEFNVLYEEYGAER